MGKYQGYQKYKDSGVEWLGDIPKHWKIIPIKLSLSICFGICEHTGFIFVSRCY